MTLDDLNRTLSKAIATQKIGTPVSLRLHLHLPDPQVELIGALSSLMQIAEPVFATKPSRLMARQDITGRQLNVLIETKAGETIFLTIGRGSADSDNLNLLLIGNRGIVRLEGPELFEFSAVDAPHVHDWSRPVEESLSKNQAVALGS